MKKILSILLVVVLAIGLGVNAFAGDGDGSGGGKNKPLTLASSTVPNGSTDVPTDVLITLTFTKNVVNFTVKDNNMGCFRLTDSAGSAVPISVIMGDDQVDPDVKRIVSVQASGLKAGETYTLTISGNLTAKSGAMLGSDVSIRFTTAGAAPAQTPAPVETAAPTETPKPSETPEPSESPEPSDSPEPTGSPEPSETPEPDKSSEAAEATPAPEQAAQSAKSNPSTWIILLCALAAVVLAAALILRKKKNDKKS